MDAIAAHTCNNLHLPPSAECINAALAYLKQFKSSLGRATFSLQQLAIRSVLKNHQRFLAVQLDNGNSTPCLENLPLAVSEKLLAAIESDLELSLEVKHNLALLLANHSTTHLDYHQFRLNNKSLGSDTPFFEKMAFDCPNLKSLDISHRVWKEFNEPGHCCLFKVVACKWKNLSVLCLDTRQYRMDGVELTHGELGCRTSPCQGQSIIRAICRHLPKLRILKVSIPPLTVEDVDELSKMEFLQYLKMDFLMGRPYSYSACGSDPAYVKHVDQIVHAAGRMPDLKKFGFCCREHSFKTPYVEFVDLFGRLYPDKKLVLEQIYLSSNLLGSWPPNLSVEELNVLCQNQQLDLNVDLFQITGPIKKLDLDTHILPEQLYTLLEKFGPDLTHLSLLILSSDINVHRVLLPCKKLEYFRMRTYDLVSGSLAIHPDHFAECSKFLLFCWFSGNPMNASVVELTKLYFLGSKQYLKRRVIHSTNEFEALTQALLMNPQHTCLDLVEEIYFQVENPTSEQHILKKIPWVLVLLMKRSPFLRYVAIFGLKVFYDPPQWFQNFLQAAGITLNKPNNKGRGGQENDLFDSSKTFRDALRFMDFQDIFLLGPRPHTSLTLPDDEDQVQIE